MTTAFKGSNFITWSEYVNSQDTHTQHARQEFGKVHNSIEVVQGNITAIRRNVEVVNQELKSDIEAAKQELKSDIETVKQELKSDIEAAKQELKSDIETVKQELKSDIETVQQDIAQLKTVFGELMVRSERTDAISRNRALRRGTQRLTPVVKYDKGRVEPVFFPKNPRDFFKLREPADERDISALIYLVHFYDVRGYQTWRAEAREEARAHRGNISSDEEEDRQLEEAISIEEATIQFPSKAVDEVATAIGLDEDTFLAFETKIEEYRRRPPQPTVKRRQSLQQPSNDKEVDNRKPKAQRIEGKQIEDKQIEDKQIEVRPSQPPSATGAYSPNTFKKIYNLGSPSTTEETVLTKVGWDPHKSSEEVGPTLLNQQNPQMPQLSPTLSVKWSSGPSLVSTERFTQDPNQHLPHHNS